MHSRLTLTALALALAAPSALAGNIYKWTDAQGQTHYSQTPPARGPSQSRPQASVQPGVKIEAPAPPPVVVAAPAAVAATPPPETAQAKAKRCAASKERVAFLEERTAQRLMIEGKDGTPSRMTEEEYNQRLKTAQDAGKGC